MVIIKNIARVTLSSVALSSLLMLSGCGGGGSATPGNGTNTAPVATTSNFSLSEDTSKSGSLLGTDIDGDTLSYGLITASNVSNGTLSLQTNGSYTYTPDANFTGTDNFTYIVSDNDTDSAQKVVTITINNVNDAPTATYSASPVTSEDTVISIQLTATDIDPNDTIIYSMVSGASSASTSLDSSTGIITYTPSANFSGTDSFSYRVKDASNVFSNTRIVSVGITAVNDAAVIINSFSNIDLNDNNGTVSYDLNVSDIEHDSLTITVDSNDSSILTIGQNWTNTVTHATYNGVALDFNLTAEANATGIAHVTIVVNDGDVNTSKTFDVNVSISPNTSLTWKSKTYNTVTSSITSKVWLDRNLGASQVCTSISDTNCYGDYYQWGREANGHQIADSNTTISTSGIPNAGTFFVTRNQGQTDDWTTIGEDDNEAKRSTNWAKTDGTSICPVGFRVPTSTELSNETKVHAHPQQAVSVTDFYNNNTLKFPKAGLRKGDTGVIIDNGVATNIWSKTINGTVSNYLDSRAPNSFTGIKIAERIYGIPIRCIKH